MKLGKIAMNKIKSHKIVSSVILIGVVYASVLTSVYYNYEEPKVESVSMTTVTPEEQKVDPVTETPLAPAESEIVLEQSAPVENKSVVQEAPVVEDTWTVEELAASNYPYANMDYYHRNITCVKAIYQMRPDMTKEQVIHLLMPQRPISFFYSQYPEARDSCLL